MKKTFFLFLVATSLFVISCSSTKTLDNKKLFDTQWELEFITGTRIAFEGLYEDEKPTLKFDNESNRVNGSNSCNGYSYKYNLKGNKLAFTEPGPATLRYCEGEGDKAFLKMMEKVETFNIDENNNFNLIANGITLLRFKKK